MRATLLVLSAVGVVVLATLIAIKAGVSLSSPDRGELVFIFWTFAAVLGLATLAASYMVSGPLRTSFRLAGSALVLLCALFVYGLVLVGHVARVANRTAGSSQAGRK